MSQPVAPYYTMARGCQPSAQSYDRQRRHSRLYALAHRRAKRRLRHAALPEERLQRQTTPLPAKAVRMPRVKRSAAERQRSTCHSPLGARVRIRYPLPSALNNPRRHPTAPRRPAPHPGVTIILNSIGRGPLGRPHPHLQPSPQTKILRAQSSPPATIKPLTTGYCRGNPSPRPAMMPFWISVVPPAMVCPSVTMY